MRSRLAAPFSAPRIHWLRRLAPSVVIMLLYDFLSCSYTTADGKIQDVGRNVCHGSDSVENAKKEIALWFKEGEVISYKMAQFDWIYEKP